MSSSVNSGQKGNEITPKSNVEPGNNMPRRQASGDSDVELISPTTPLIGTAVKPSLAKPETEESDDDRDRVNKPQPGVDDGFFNDNEDADKNPKHPNSEHHPTEKHPNNDDGMALTPRAGNDGHDNHNDRGGTENHGHLHPSFPYAPGFGLDGHHDVDILSNADGTILPDVNVYQHKKTLAQGMMDLALFSANANQLRYVLETYERHPYYYPSVIMISFSLLLQVAVGIGLIWNATYNVKDEKEICLANRINNFTVIGIFLITVVNVFVSAFGVADAK